MSTFNLRYDIESPTHLVGQVADSRLTQTITTVAAGTVAFGQPVGYDNQLLDSDAPMKGVARLDITLEQTDAGVVNYVSGDSMPLVMSGPIWVTTDSAVAAGAAAYVTVATGLFTATASGATTTNAVGFFETATTGAGDAVLYVQRGGL